tara:strand:+ start:13 stop:477 length:465 start_codon:yes stop_codon:yes gene_type:complete
MSTLRVDNLRGETADNTNRYVVQVVYGSLSSELSYSNDSNHDIMSVSITPTSANNKIILMGNFAHYLNHSSTTERGDYQFKRDGTVVFQTATNGYGYFRDGSSLKVMNNTHNFLDSPATTSAVSYTMAHRPHTYGSGGSFGATVTNLTLMEISQ